MKKSKLFSLIAMVLAVLMVFSACGNTSASKQAGSDGKAVTITYCNFNSSGGNEGTLDKMVAAFEAEHPNIKVDVETIG